MENKYELLTLDYLQDSFGEELIPEMLQIGIIHLAEFIEQLTEIKQSRNYHRQFFLVYRIDLTMFTDTKLGWSSRLELRKYLLFGYFRKASNLFELKEIHKFLFWLLNNKYSNLAQKNAKPMLNNLLTGDGKEFFAFCYELPKPKINTNQIEEATTSEKTKFDYYYSILSEMYNVSTEEEMVRCFDKYDKLAQESLDKLISFIQKLLGEIKVEMRLRGLLDKQDKGLN